MAPTTKNKTNIKFFEVLNWLTGNDPKIPDKFLENSTKLNGIVPYVAEQLWTQPALVSYLNKYTNDLYKIPDPIELLTLLYKLFKNYQITKFDLWQYIPNRQPDLIKAIQERDDLDEGNARSKFQLIHKLKINTSSYFKSAPTKNNLEYNKEDIELVQQVITKKAAEPVTVEKEYNNYIEILDQETIDELDLVLFDITLLKKTNRVLFIFIDKYYQKRYHIVPFRAVIYLSQQTGVINNDYIEDKNSDKFIEYILNEIGLYNKLKFTLASNYKRILNGV